MKLSNNWLKCLPVLIIGIIISIITFSSCEQETGFTTELALNNDSIYVPKDTKTTRIIVFSDRSWTVIKEDSTIHWITLSKDSLERTSGKGNGSFLVNIKTNESNAIRMATLIISTENESHRLTLRQDIK